MLASKPRKQLSVLTVCSHNAALGIALWFSSNPAKSRLKSITKLPIRLATPPSLNTMPMKRHIAAAARLKRTRTNINLRNSGHAGVKPDMGYTIAPIIMGGINRSGTMSKTTLAAKYVIGE